MEDTKAMPHPPSPPSPPHADPAEGLGTFPPSKDDFSAPVPLYTSTPLPSSPRPSASTSTMTTTLQDIAPSMLISPPTLKDLQYGAVGKVDDPDTMQWGHPGNPLVNSMDQEGSSFSLPMHLNPGPTAAYNYDRSAYNDNYNLAYQSGLPSSCPRSLSNNYGMNLLPPSTGINMSSYPPSLYQMGPQQPYEGMDLSQSPNNNLMQLDQEFQEYEAYPLRAIPEDISAYSTPMPSYDSDMSRSTTPDPIDVDQPYAQLIYKALMQAPNNTMILRDIYDWFRRNTAKAADKDTKGWQNSIRHNLSMNGAFEKVDQPCEESRKGFMWRLTEEAKQHGVKSTTRYRSKQPNKRGHRSGLYPQKQRAGAIGGRNAKKQLRHRRMNDAYRSEPYQSRSIPTPATFDSVYNSEMAMFARSPYYSSSSSEIDHLEYPNDTFGNPVEVCRPGMMHDTYTHGLPTHGLPTHGLPMVSSPHGSSPLGAYDAYIQMPSDPAEPLFTASPSPTASEPRTPPDSDTHGCYDNRYGPLSNVGLCFDPYIPLGDSTYAHEPLGDDE